MGCCSAFQRDQKKQVLFLELTRSSGQSSEDLSEEWELNKKINKFNNISKLGRNMLIPKCGNKPKNIF
jgi:hypothetical protein